MAICYSNFTVIACFLVIFVIIIIKITIIIIIIIIATIIIIIKKIWSYAQNVVFDVRKKRTQLPELGGWGGGLGDSGNARRKKFFFPLRPSLIEEYSFL